MNRPLRILLLALLLTLSLASSATAQSRSRSIAPFRTGTQLAGPGIGFISYGTLITGQYEIGVGEKVGIGYFGVGGLAGLYLYTGGSFFSLGAQGNYHFDINEPNWDLFAGITLLFNFANYYGYAPLGINVGARYFVAPNVALFARAGFGYSVLNVGVDFKF